LLSGFKSTDAGREAERALVHAEASGDREMRRAALNTLVNGYLCAGPVPAAEAIVRCEELLESVAGDQLLEATVKRPLALFQAMQGHAGKALALHHEAGVILDELNLRSMEVYRQFAAYTLRLAGDRLGAEAELKRMWLYFRDIRGDAFDNRAANAAAELGHLYCDDGRWDEAADMDAFGRNSDDRESRVLTLEARVAARVGRADAAEELAEEAVSIAEKRPQYLTVRAQAWETLAELKRVVGKPVDADAAVATAVAHYEQKGNIVAAERLRDAAQTTPGVSSPR